jgi:hypothetical protein
MIFILVAADGTTSDLVLSICLLERLQLVPFDTNGEV